MELNLYNTATRKVDRFEPLDPPQVKLYSCGMTVYYYAHIGHLRNYVSVDILRRTLEYMGYNVRHVMNVTDVGHMTSDQDEGEDKIEAGAKREGKSPWEIARHYEGHFFNTIHHVNIQSPHVISRATEHIQEQIDLIKRLEERGFTYRTDVGVIFDTEKFERYAEFARLNLDEQEAGARVNVDAQRKRPWDFALWVTNKPNHLMQWDSPWGRGYPGWHLECSAMAMRYLGEEIDIHTGGIDHIPIHHTNEIAQSECATGRKFARYWFHVAFLNIDNTKMSKSLDNLYTLEDLEQRSIVPLALRYFFLTSSYRKALNFTWEALGGAQKGLIRLWQACQDLPAPAGEPLKACMDKFEQALGDDLNTSAALAALWEMLESDEAPERKARTAFQMDRILALDLSSARTRLSDYHWLQGSRPEAEQEAEKLMQQRQQFRKQRNFSEADRLRDEIKELGFYVEDTPEGPKLRPLDEVRVS